MPLAYLHQPIYQKRISVLSTMLLPYLRDGDQVLDIGSGFGELGKRVSDKASEAGKTVQVCGIEKHPRGNEKIETISFDGYHIPSQDGAYEVVMLADVIHHEENYMQLLKEAVRVTSRYLIIKDHVAAGFLGHQRICFMDWAANNPYGVKCLYRYFNLEQWSEIHQQLGLEVHEQHHSIRLYQEPFNFIFGNRLQYLAVLTITGDSNEA